MTARSARPCSRAVALFPDHRREALQIPIRASRSKCRAIASMSFALHIGWSNSNLWRTGGPPAKRGRQRDNSDQSKCSRRRRRLEVLITSSQPSDDVATWAQCLRRAGARNSVQRADGYSRQARGGATQLHPPRRSRRPGSDQRWGRHDGHRKFEPLEALGTA